MDAKNDDSAGSDSLDKSLQKKCIVDDAMGDGVEQTTSTSETASAITTSKGVVGEGSGAGAGEGAAQTDAAAKNLKTDEQSDVVAAASDKATTIKTKTDASCAGTHNKTDKQNSERNSKKMTNTLEAESSNSSCSTASSSNSSAATTAAASTASSSSLAPGSLPGKAFETKVKQISKNLQETTLAAASTKVTLEDTTSSSSTSSSSSSSSSTASSSSSSSSSTNSSASNTTEFEPPQTAATTIEQEPDDAASLKSLPAAQVSTPNTSANLSPSLLQDDDMDELDTTEARAKKVRFHPDVKENDGGNRVGKKKKRMKGAVGGACGSAASSGDAHCAATRLDYDVDMDDDEDDTEEEDEFDLAKTIAEAQDYLKEHPLSFVGPSQKLAGGAKLKSGLLEEEDLKQLGSDSSDEEADFYANSKPENGIERIVGKQIRSGIVEFLLRYVDRPGLFWVTEDFIGKQCPTLYNEYELNRERRQQRLMRYVAKRQNLRQRYTDF